MTYRRGVCLVRFDDQLGPGCLYSSGLDSKFAQKVCMKSHLSTLSLSSQASVSTEDYVESVIPFIDEGYIAYSTFFFIEDDTARGGKRTLGIVTLVDRSQQLTLYKSIPELAATIRDIASELALLGDPKEKLSEQIIEKLNQLTKIESLTVNFDIGMDSTELIKKRLAEIEKKPETDKVTSLEMDGDFDYLFEQIPNGLDKVIFALLKNERIIIVGEEDDISKTLATLKWFLPHKKLYNDLWTVPLIDAEALFSRSQESTTLHILGIQNQSFQELTETNQIVEDDILIFNDELDQMKTSMKKMPLESKIVINLNEGSVYGGISNRFCQRLLNTIKGKPYLHVLEIISDHVDYLITRVSDLTELILDDVTQQRIQLFVESAIDGELSLIITIISETNPNLMNKIMDLFSKHQMPLEVLF